MKICKFCQIFLLIILFAGCQSVDENQDANKKNLTGEADGNNPVAQRVIPLTPIEKYDKQLLRKVEENSKIKKPYVLNPGDKIEISILDNSEMTREVFVLPDGSINYLLVGRIEAQGMTPEELSGILSEKLSKYLKDPNVSVIIKSLETKSDVKSYVSVVGAVQKPGKIEIKEGDRLLDVITSAGGLLFINDIWGGRAVANLNSAYVSRNGEKLDLSFDKLLREGDMGHNIALQDGDFIYFPESDTSNIIVLGEVSHPNIIPFTRDISVIEAISRCGGFTDNAQKGTVIVLRVKGEETEMKKIDLEAILKGNEKIANINLKGGDIVFVPKQGLSEYERYASQIMTFADLILKGYQVREQIRFPRLHRRDTHFY